jgi:hypothetical protein
MRPEWTRSASRRLHSSQGEHLVAAADSPARRGKRAQRKRERRDEPQLCERELVRDSALASAVASTRAGLLSIKGQHGVMQTPQLAGSNDASHAQDAAEDPARSPQRARPPPAREGKPRGQGQGQRGQPCEQDREGRPRRALLLALRSERLATPVLIRAQASVARILDCFWKRLEQPFLRGARVACGCRPTEFDTCFSDRTVIQTAASNLRPLRADLGAFSDSRTFVSQPASVSEPGAGLVRFGRARRTALRVRANVGIAR